METDSQNAAPSALDAAICSAGSLREFRNEYMVEFCDGATTYKNLTPGRYRREWAGYGVEVWIRRLGDGSLVEIAPSHMHSDPASMPDAKWFPLPNADAEPRPFKP